MKQCTVGSDWEKKCPDSRIFLSTVRAMEGIVANSSKTEEILEGKLKEVLVSANKLCESLNCPYLKEIPSKENERIVSSK